MTTLKDGLASSMRSVADRGMALFGVEHGGDDGQKGNAAHMKPPTPEWDKEATGGRPAERASYERRGGGGPTEPRDFGDVGSGGKGMASYSWDNPPPKPGRANESDEDEDAVKEKTMEDLFGMDKEPSKKLLKKKAARAKEPGALHAAVYAGDTVDARELLELGANVNEARSEEDSKTPLLVAASKGNADMVRLLLKNGADLDAKDDCDNNALHIACSKGHADVANRLIKAGCDVASIAGNGATALHLAARKGHDDVIDLLLEHGMNIESVDGKGATPLHAACSGGYEHVVLLLIKHRANVHAVDGKGKTPRQIATKKGHDDCAKIIKKAIKEEEANAAATKRLAEERAQRAKLKEEAETKAALEAHRLHEIEVQHPEAPANDVVEGSPAVCEETATEVEEFAESTGEPIPETVPEPEMAEET